MLVPAIAWKLLQKPPAGSPAGIIPLAASARLTPVAKAAAKKLRHDAEQHQAHRLIDDPVIADRTSTMQIRAVTAAATSYWSWEHARDGPGRGGELRGHVADAEVHAEQGDEKAEEPPT